jgi:uncharacterized damage-inducible protein DinB
MRSRIRRDCTANSKIQHIGESSMRTIPTVLLFLCAAVLFVPSAFSQEQHADEVEVATAVRDRFVRHFEQSSRKMVSLSDAMPAEDYTWSPGDGVMSVARVYAHIARYNYYYLESSLGIAAPAGVDLDSMEELTDKEAVRRVLIASVEHVKQHVPAMTVADLSRTVKLYGEDVSGWAVLLQLVAHMNEHVGQSVAYARMNGVKPPWSR